MSQSLWWRTGGKARQRPRLSRKLTVGHALGHVMGAPTPSTGKQRGGALCAKPRTAGSGASDAAGRSAGRTRVARTAGSDASDAAGRSAARSLRRQREPGRSWCTHPQTPEAHTQPGWHHYLAPRSTAGQLEGGICQCQATAPRSATGVSLGRSLKLTFLHAPRVPRTPPTHSRAPRLSAEAIRRHRPRWCAATSEPSRWCQVVNS